MSAPPSVSVILVNYNGKKHLDCCLTSLRESSFTDFETLLVDNGSSDGSVDYVRERFPWVQVIQMGFNSGFSKANNVAASKAKGEFLAFLNNDVEVTSPWLSELVQAARRPGDTVAWASKMLIFDQRYLINGVGGVMTQVGYTCDRGMYEPDHGQYDAPAEVLFPCAGACLIRAEAFAAAGAFDERFFMYHEDVDLGWTLWLLGGRVVTTPSAVIYHKFGGTSKATMGVLRREIMGERNNIRALIKHYEWPNLVRALRLLLTQRQSPQRKAALLRSFGWNLRYLGETLKLRGSLQRRRQRTDAEMKKLILPGTRVPLSLPDYPIATAESYAATGRKVLRITMGENELGCLAYGWHLAEPNPSGDGKRVRWTEKQACFYLSPADGQTQLHFRVYAMSHSTGVLSSGQVQINGRPAGRFSCAEEGWHDLVFPLPGANSVRALEICLRLDQTWTPKAVFGNDDPRVLGIAVASAWVE